MLNLYSECRANLERKLADFHERKHCILTGRGATAMYIAYNQIVGNRGYVVMPATLCASPAYTAMASGYKTLFCDTSEETLQMSTKYLDALLQSYSDISVIVMVHMYGRPADVEGILALAERYKIPVIEDAAQALGVKCGSKMAGSFGDVSVLSFGHTKILDVGWGGALLTDDDDLYRRMKKVELDLPERPNNIHDRFNDYRYAYYTFQSESTSSSVGYESYYQLLNSFDDIYVFKFDSKWCENIEIEFSKLEGLVDKRRENEDLYYKLLGNQEYIILIPQIEGTVPWRFNVMLPEGRQERITQRLRQEGWDASNWYPSLTNYFVNPEKCESAEKIGKTILNLWLTPDIDSDYIHGVSQSLISLLQEDS